MVKRARNDPSVSRSSHVTISEDVVHSTSARTYSSRLRSSNTTTTNDGTTGNSTDSPGRRVRTVAANQTTSPNQNSRGRRDYSSDNDRRKRPRNASDMHGYNDRRNTSAEMAVNSAREARQTRPTSSSMQIDPLTLSRSECNLPTSTISPSNFPNNTSRRTVELIQTSQHADSTGTDENPVGRAVELFVQARTATQGMKSLMSENEQLFQEFKTFLINNLPGAGDIVYRDSGPTPRCDEISVQKATTSAATNTSMTLPVNFVNESAIEWTDDLKSSLKCTICQEFCHQCVSTCPCFHTFCGGCLSTWFERCASKKTCPTCREVIFSVSKNIHADQIVKSYLASFPADKRSQSELDELQTKDRLYCSNVVLLHDPRGNRRRRLTGESSNVDNLDLSDISDNRVPLGPSDADREWMSVNDLRELGIDPNPGRISETQDETDSTEGGGGGEGILNQTAPSETRYWQPPRPLTMERRSTFDRRPQRNDTYPRPTTSQSARMQGTFVNAGDAPIEIPLETLPMRIHRRSMIDIPNGSRMVNLTVPEPDERLTLSEASAEIVSSFLDGSDDDNHSSSDSGSTEETAHQGTATTSAVSSTATTAQEIGRRPSPRVVTRVEPTTPRSVERPVATRHTRRRPRVRVGSNRNRAALRQNRRSRAQEPISSRESRAGGDQHNYAARGQSNADTVDEDNEGSDSNYETRINVDVEYELNSYTSNDDSNSDDSSLSVSSTDSSLHFSSN